MTLSAVSVSGKTGTSGPIEVTLPQRAFHNPLARALVEQRRDLILDPDNAPKRIETALTGLTIAPELFDTAANVYLGLKQVNSSLQAAHTDAELLDVAAALWALAQQIEDGDSSQAERDLRAAEQALREALQRGASDEEIRKLMQNLREAAKRFMSQMARNDQSSANPDDQAMQAQDLDKLLDRMEDTARNGAREDAEAMLDQMQEMFENMRSAGDAQESPAERQMRKQIGELEKLLHDQQALRDDTFRSDQRDRARKRGQNRMAPGQEPGQDQSQPGEDGPQSDLDEGDNDSDPSAKPGQEGADPDAPTLDQRQRALRDRLAELQRKLKGLGMKGEKGFDDAQGDMKEAEGDLHGEQGSPGKGQGKRGRRQGRGGRRPGTRPGGAAPGRARPAEADAKSSRAETARADMWRAGPVRANSRAKIRSDAGRKATRAARTGRSRRPQARPNALAASWRNCDGASPIPPGRPTNSTISSG